MGRFTFASRPAPACPNGRAGAGTDFCRLAAGILGLIEGTAESGPPTTFRKDHAMSPPRVALIAAALLIAPATAGNAQMIVGPAAGPGPGMGQAPPAAS